MITGTGGQGPGCEPEFLTVARKKKHSIKDSNRWFCLVNGLNGLSSPHWASCSAKR